MSSKPHTNLRQGSETIAGKQKAAVKLSEKKKGAYH